MIEITEFEDRVEVEGKVFETDDETHAVNTNDKIIDMIKEIIDKAKYSGESITLWYVDGSMKILVQEW